MLERSQAPAFKSVESVKLAEAEKDIFQNEIPLYSVGFASQEVIKLELVFEAGSAFEKKRGTSALFSKLLLGGTKTRTGSEIMAGFDQYGGFIEVSSRIERLYIVLYGLPKYLDKYLAIIKDMLENSVFPEDELELQRKISLQNMRLNMEKSSYLANREFKRAMFGSLNPYGSVLNGEDFETVTREDLINFYESNVQGKSFRIFASGNVKEKEKQLLNNFFGKESYMAQNRLDIPFEIFNPSKKLVTLENKMQSTIRLGKPLFDRLHPDFFPMAVTNTVFGGYFGSRLMTNIREDKGFTYGISSSINPLRGFGYMMIGSDVVKENTEDTLKEIEKEINLLRNEEVSQNELETVKNYMSGSFAGSITTAFELMDKHKNIILSELPSDYYDSFIDRINSVTTLQVSEVANKHLSMQALSEVVVGEKI
ncbi:pitrilysin family protein [uncultured Arcticibacterium sp.]|uniref:M16 family metallopeptidase n=1 Tax=uncultured Arcticibacterium sp. TaxID=2173042 RepID=UPI0030FB88E7